MKSPLFKIVWHGFPKTRHHECRFCINWAFHVTFSCSEIKCPFSAFADNGNFSSFRGVDSAITRLFMLVWAVSGIKLSLSNLLENDQVGVSQRRVGQILEEKTEYSEKRNKNRGFFSSTLSTLFPFLWYSRERASQKRNQCVVFCLLPFLYAF